MKEDVIAANLANLRQSVNELKETVNKLNFGRFTSTGILMIDTILFPSFLLTIYRLMKSRINKITIKSCF